MDPPQTANGDSSNAEDFSNEEKQEATELIQTAGGDLVPCNDDKFPSEVWFEWLQIYIKTLSPSPKSIISTPSSDSLDGRGRPVKGAGILTEGIGIPETISTRFAPFIRSQIEADLYHIQLWNDAERTGHSYLLNGPDWTSGTEHTPWGDLVIDETATLAQTMTATVFNVNMERSARPPSDPLDSRPAPSGLVIKYQADPATRTLPLHSLMVDAWILYHLRDEGVTPRVYFLSPQFPTPRVRPTASTKLHFLKSFSQDLWEERFFRKRIVPASTSDMSVNRPFFSTVRFSVMERVGDSIHKVVSNALNGRIPLSHALKMGASMITSLKKIHNRGIVHGDIHAGNICVETLKSDTKMIFIDFGRAFFDDANLKHMQGRAPFSVNEVLYSHWDIEGWMPGKRDDLFKVFLVMSAMINGHGIYDYLKELTITEAWQWKAIDNFFVTPKFNVFSVTSPEFTRATAEESAAFALSVRNRIDYILQKLRSLQTIHTPIDYDDFISQLKAVSKSISKKTPLPEEVTSPKL